MAQLIRDEFRGCPITIGITGLPVTITGIVVNTTNCTENISLRLEDGRIVTIAENLIAFFL